MSNKYLQIESQAIQQRWPISAQMRQAIIERLLRIVADKDSSKREQLIAIKTLMTAEAQNQADEHTAAIQSDRNRFLAVAQRLGIDGDFRLVNEERADSSLGGANGPEDAQP